MRVAPEGWIFIAIAWAVVLILAATKSWLLVLWLPLAVWVIAFFRDPVREGPGDERLVLAPADGKVVGIREIDEPAFVGDRTTRISIFMSVFDVHVNRYPSSGVVAYHQYHSGRFLNAAAEKSSAENEQASIGLDTPRGKLLVRQIAGLIARRIVTDHTVGAVVKQGERMGIIRFGSRVDLFVPQSARVLLEDGQVTRAGVTVVAKWV